jgi:hypothetical protein
MRTWLIRSRDGGPELADGNDQLSPGCHLVTARAGYTHHGIYVGDGMVVQYSGRLARGVCSGSVEELPLQKFAGGRPFWIDAASAPCFEADEIVRRARSRVGEHRYDLLTNNCEHFCEWCLHGRQRSYQVERLFGQNGGIDDSASRARLTKMLERALGFLSRLNPGSQGFSDEEELRCQQGLKN